MDQWRKGNPSTPLSAPGLEVKVRMFRGNSAKRGDMLERPIRATPDLAQLRWSKCRAKREAKGQRTWSFAR